ncbi:hypothetical protein RAC89_13020 [Paenibacillus sp. GD4]|nr:hypothetical protein [Paenibacillus sp. GD4]MDQ1911357.1 hypothetical protein [Paenibacillus sp. GD4]
MYTDAAVNARPDKVFDFLCAMLTMEAQCNNDINRFVGNAAGM